ncbi:putative secreted RxLR effector protein [Phytophthora cinnamomi]|uniref:putative secreted RxLR effector protein n=1 Tax=Phytophthora cinnamomi TaxID=4785 RepID=UPI00355A3C2E|nr:putative secreted RxLR effector protein [Phytophthora cinnamomi]
MLLLLSVAALLDTTDANSVPTNNIRGDQVLSRWLAEREANPRRLLRTNYNFADADAVNTGREERAGAAVIQAYYAQQRASSTAKIAKKAADAIEQSGKSGKLKRLNAFVQKELEPFYEYSLFTQFYYTKKLDPAKAKAALFDEYGMLGEKLANRYAAFYANEQKMATLNIAH